MQRSAVVDWISSLLHTLCPYCGEELGTTRRACAACASKLAAIEGEPAVATTVGDLRVCAGFHYEGWAGTLVLRQKQVRSLHATRWMAALLRDKMPARWRSVPVAWLPGRPLAGLHLVEAVALELGRLGQPLARRCYFQRRLRPAPAQKTLDLAERTSRDMSEVYRISRTFGTKDDAVLLLDDVVTTGSTIRGCQRMLEERLGIEVRGVLAVAYTPPKRAKARLSC